MKIETASFAYKNGLNIFSDISFYLDKGDVLSIMGANGVGKTTLIKCIAGILNFSSGSMDIDYSIKISYVPQSKQTNLSYNVLDFISFGRNGLNVYFAKPTNKDYEISKKIIKDLQIESLQDKNINAISGGELQMCYIAKALSSEPDILILDEAESNLDFYNQRMIIKLLKKLSDMGTIVILNTHYINHASRISNKCLLMFDGGHIFGNKDEVLNIQNLEKCFNVPIQKVRVDDGEGNKYDNYIIV